MEEQVTAPTTVSFSKVQLNALESLYNATNGKEWRWYVDESYFGVHWNFTTSHPNPCTPQKWQGITCSNTICSSSHPCNVVELALPDFRMKGILPQSISNLTYLTSLDLASNSLFGPIPTTISKLTALTNLQLTSNSFNGSIPSSISKLTKLRTLNLAQNHLQGSIPPSLYTGLTALTSWIMNNNLLNGEISPLIGVMNSLTEIDFGFNFFGGVIPSNISYCHNLQTLILTSNLFTGSLNNLTNPSLIKLDLSANGFRGSVPATINQLINLQHLDLSINQFTSTIPETLYSIKNLTSLLLTENNLRGTLSPNITQLKQMKLFDIENNKMYGSLPSNIGDLNASLESLQLGKNDFTGALPDSLCQLVNLIRFTAGQCHFNSTIPQEIGNLTKLRYLDLNHNQLNGTIPIGITLLKELNSIDFSNNLLYGTIPSSFGSNSNQTLLNNINFKKNQLSGSIRDCFNDLLLLQSLSLSFNNFTGSLSKDFFMNNKQLNFLDLSFNQFTGPLPSEINSNNNQLATIYLENNQFNGSLPSQIGNWNQLLVINLENNAFTGNIPTSFCEINQINVLYMSNNRFKGRLPSCLTNLTQLSRIELINNHFTGQLPEIFDELRRLSHFLASDNQFFGTLPITLGQASLLDTLYIENNLLTGPIPSSYGTDLIHLRFLKLDSNQLNGTLPIVLGQLQQFEVLSVTNNQLTGEIHCQVKNSSISFIKTLLLAYNQFSNTIPRELCQLYGLEDLSLYNNYFIDLIPNCFNNISALSNISLSSNYLYNTIPNSLGNVILLSELYLDNNLLTGSIPSSFSHLFELQILSLSNNDFTGSLPIHFNELRKISFINISFNHLTGPLSNRFIRMEQLQTLLVNDNRFSSSIEQLFNSTIRLRINTIDLSSNQLTGTIPSYVFNNSRQLLSFAAIDNCFSGKIPEEICNAETLTAIALDGLHTSSAFFNNKKIEYKWITWIKKNFLLLQTWWEVYQSIHLSNFYLQPLDHIYDFGIVMKGIRTMTIRLTIFIIVFLLPVHIGLSTVYGTYTYQYAWVLSMAYLSGFLPAVVLFFCLFLFLVYIGQNLAFLAASNEQQAPLNGSSSSTSSSMRQQSTSSSSILKPKAVRYEFLFSWKLLKKNMSKSLLIEMIGLGILNCLITLVVQFSFVFAVTSASSLNNRSINMISFVISLFFVFWNNMIVIGLFSKRIRYLQDQFRLTSSLPFNSSQQVTINPLTSDHALPLQQVHHESRPTTVPDSRDTGIAPTTFTLSTLPMTEGNQLSSSATIITKEDNSNNLNIYYSNKEDNLFNEERRIFFLTYLLTFNNVIAPLIAALFISPDCFYYLLVTPPSITTDYNVVVCDKEVGSYIYEGICLDYNVLTPSVSFIPPFLYSYQCSSTLLPIFASFNLYRYFFTGVLIPISRIVLKLVQEWYYKHYGSTSIFYLISLMMLSPSRILYDDDTDVPKAIINTEDGEIGNQLTDGEVKRKEEREKINLTFFNKRQFINRDYIVLPIISEFTVFITFGAIFPPLAIVVCYTICITTLFIQTIIGRVVVISRTQSAMKKYLSKMNEECRNFRRLFLQSIPLISILASFFWGFFLFDILGDSDSSSVSTTVWIFIMMGFAPIISYVAEVLLDKVFEKVCSNDTERDVRGVRDEENHEEKSKSQIPTFQEESSDLPSSDDKDVI
eukprot:gene10101-10980_t